jgi:RNA polymerase sigma factor (sigma-70 family)
MEALRLGDGEAARRIWQRYHRAMLRVAVQRMPLNCRRQSDEEDVVLSAFESLFGRAKQGEFARFQDREDLWRLLVTITCRKVINLVERERRLKRGGGATVVETDMHSTIGARHGLAHIADKSPPPEAEIIMAQTRAALFARLPDDQARRIAQGMLDGRTQAEIAASANCARATVARRLVVIRRLWNEYLENERE